MTLLTHIVMLGWIPLVILFFQLFEPRRAVLFALFAGWLFLPNAEYPLSGLPNYDKITATCVGVFLGSLVADSRRYSRLRLRAIDVPVALLCVAPFLAAIANDLGPYGITVNMVSGGLLRSTDASSATP